MSDDNENRWLEMKPAAMSFEPIERANSGQDQLRLKKNPAEVVANLPLGEKIYAEAKLPAPQTDGEKDALKKAAGCIAAVQQAMRGAQ